MTELPVLTIGQYQIIYNSLSFAFAAMGASFIFFLFARTQVPAKYKSALLVSALVVVIAAYHYFRIFESFAGSYVVSGSVYEPSGEPFNNAYRYIDWLLTVPLLLVEAVAALGLSREKSSSLIGRLSIAAVLMIALGYPGEITSEFGPRFGWGFASTLPFIYILWILWGELGEAVKGESEELRKLFRNLRLLLLGTWGVYPIAYMIPMFGLTGAWAFVGVEVGYTIADVLAKPGFGLLIYAIVREKARLDSGAPAAAAGD